MRVSLIMTTYNCADTLPNILEAAEEQIYPDLEIVIKDGLSDDGTVQIIKEFADSSTKNVIWDSKKDSGIYEAMNQGFALAHGDLIAFCSDILEDENVVADMVRAVQNAGDACIGAHGDLLYMNGPAVVRYWRMGSGKIKQGWMPGHPTLYLKRSVYEQNGLYKTNYKIAADYEYMVRTLLDEENHLAYVPRVVVRMYYGGTSTNGLASYWESFTEGNRALRENAVAFPVVISIRRTIRLLLQFRNARKFSFISEKSGTVMDKK